LLRLGRASREPGVAWNFDCLGCKDARPTNFQITTLAFHLCSSVFICGKMNSFDNELNLRLTAFREQNLFRELRRVDSAQGPRIEIGGKTFLNFSSNDYLGLANHPALKQAAIKAIEKFGVGAGASRLVCGSLAPFHELEESLAAFKKTEAALTFSTGYAAALGTICALVGKDDIIILDKLVHASIVDAAKLSGAKLRIFDHSDLDDLEDKLKWATKKSRIQNPESRILVVTESIFSMDGDAAPLREIVGLKNKYGAWLMVDEAHATGIIGQNGRGLADELGISDQIEIQMGTLGKALGASGGYICGARALVDFLVNRARSFIFSTAPVPAAAAAATAGIQIVQSAEGEKLREKLFARIKHLNSKLKIQNSKLDSAIIPLILGDENTAIAAAAKLREQNIFVPAIRFPTVARGAARLRITLTAAHSEDNVSTLARELKQIGNRQSAIGNQK
jgi:8-amino-7-oxononanoate synthase